MDRSDPTLGTLVKCRRAVESWRRSVRRMDPVVAAAMKAVVNSEDGVHII